MNALSLLLPNHLAQESKKAAQQLGLSRSEFIRRAISHELALIEAKQERQSMKRSLQAMSQNRAYMKSSMIDEEFGADLKAEPKEWWKKTKR